MSKKSRTGRHSHSQITQQTNRKREQSSPKLHMENINLSEEFDDISDDYLEDTSLFVVHTATKAEDGESNVKMTSILAMMNGKEEYNASDEDNTANFEITFGEDIIVIDNAELSSSLSSCLFNDSESDLHISSVRSSVEEPSQDLQDFESRKTVKTAAEKLNKVTHQMFSSPATSSLNLHQLSDQFYHAYREFVFSIEEGANTKADIPSLGCIIEKLKAITDTSSHLLLVVNAATVNPSGKEKISSAASAVMDCIDQVIAVCSWETDCCNTEDKSRDDAGILYSLDAVISTSTFGGREYELDEEDSKIDICVSPKICVTTDHLIIQDAETFDENDKLSAEIISIGAKSLLKNETLIKEQKVTTDDTIIKQCVISEHDTVRRRCAVSPSKHIKCCHHVRQKECKCCCFADKENNCSMLCEDDKCIKEQKVTIDDTIIKPCVISEHETVRHRCAVSPHKHIKCCHHVRQKECKCCCFADKENNCSMLCEDDRCISTNRMVTTEIVVTIEHPSEDSEDDNKDEENIRPTKMSDKIIVRDKVISTMQDSSAQTQISTVEHLDLIHRESPVRDAPSTRRKSLSDITLVSDDKAKRKMALVKHHTERAFNEQRIVTDSRILSDRMDDLIILEKRKSELHVVLETITEKTATPETEVATEPPTETNVTMATDQESVQEQETVSEPLVTTPKPITDVVLVEQKQTVETNVEVTQAEPVTVESDLQIVECPTSEEEIIAVPSPETPKYQAEETSVATTESEVTDQGQMTSDVGILTEKELGTDVAILTERCPTPEKRIGTVDDLEVPMNVERNSWRTSDVDTCTDVSTFQSLSEHHSSESLEFEVELINVTDEESEPNFELTICHTQHGSTGCHAQHELTTCHAQHGLTACHAQHGVNTCHAQRRLTPCHAQHGLTPCHAQHGLTPCHTQHGLTACHAQQGLATCRAQHGLTACHAQQGLATCRAQHGLTPCHAQQGLATCRAQHGLTPCHAQHGLTPCRAQHGLTPCHTQHGLTPCHTQHGLTACHAQHGFTNPQLINLYNLLTDESTESVEEEVNAADLPLTVLLNQFANKERNTCFNVCPAIKGGDGHQKTLKLSESNLELSNENPKLVIDSHQPVIDSTAAKSKSTSSEENLPQDGSKNLNDNNRLTQMKPSEKNDYILCQALAELKWTQTSINRLESEKKLLHSQLDEVMQTGFQKGKEQIEQLMQAESTLQIFHQQHEREFHLMTRKKEELNDSVHQLKSEKAKLLKKLLQTEKWCEIAENKVKENSNAYKNAQISFNTEKKELKNEVAKLKHELKIGQTEKEKLKEFLKISKAEFSKLKGEFSKAKTIQHKQAEQLQEAKDSRNRLVQRTNADLLSKQKIQRTLHDNIQRLEKEKIVLEFELKSETNKVTILQKDIDTLWKKCNQQRSVVNETRRQTFPQEMIQNQDAFCTWVQTPYKNLSTSLTTGPPQEWEISRRGRSNIPQSQSQISPSQGNMLFQQSMPLLPQEPTGTVSSLVNEAEGSPQLLSRQTLPHTPASLQARVQGQSSVKAPPWPIIRAGVVSHPTAPNSNQSQIGQAEPSQNLPTLDVQQDAQYLKTIVDEEKLIKSKFQNEQERNHRLQRKILHMKISEEKRKQHLISKLERERKRMRLIMEKHKHISKDATQQLYSADIMLDIEREKNKVLQREITAIKAENEKQAELNLINTSQDFERLNSRLTQVEFGQTIEKVNSFLEQHQLEYQLRIAARENEIAMEKSKLKEDLFQLHLNYEKILSLKDIEPSEMYPSPEKCTPPSHLSILHLPFTSKLIFDPTPTRKQSFSKDFTYCVHRLGSQTGDKGEHRHSSHSFI